MKALRKGVEFVWAHPVILAIMALDFGQNFFGSGRALMPVFARDILGVGPQGLGLLYTANSVGAIAMGAVMSMRRPVQRPVHGYSSASAFTVFSRLCSVSRTFLVVLSDARRSGSGQHGEFCTAQHD